MKDVSIPRGTDLPEERRERSESSRFKPDSQTGKKDKTGPFTSPELNRYCRTFERYKDQPPIHPSDVPTHQMTKYDRPSTSVEEGTRGGNAPRESRTGDSHFTPEAGESASHPRDDREAVSTGNERELDRQYYIRKALSNLAATSRTSAGTIDTSGSRGKERLMQATSGDEAAKKAVSNYAAVLEYLYDEKGREFGSADDLRRFVEQVARNINAGITREGVLLRETDSGKFPYTPVQHLERENNQFYNELFCRFGDPDIDSVETAAWIEYRVKSHGSLLC